MKLISQIALLERRNKLTPAEQGAMRMWVGTLRARCRSLSGHFWTGRVKTGVEAANQERKGKGY
jgi:hypothetical protein